MIGSNSRFAGKTTLACSIISKLSSSCIVYGLKATKISPGEKELHGDHSSDNGIINLWLEETNFDSTKDTALMHRAGAHKVFYLRFDDRMPANQLTAWLESIPKEAPIVCESRSLVKLVKPGLFIILNIKPAIGKEKNNAGIEHYADKIYLNSTDRKSIDQIARSIRFCEGIFKFSDREQ